MSGGAGDMAEEAEEESEFALDSMEGGRMRRKSKRQVLVAKDVDIDKVPALRRIVSHKSEPLMSKNTVFVGSSSFHQ